MIQPASIIMKLNNFYKEHKEHILNLANIIFLIVLICVVLFFISLFVLMSSRGSGY
jgi:glycopeptide antibiotics resistance protein